MMSSGSDRRWDHVIVSSWKEEFIWFITFFKEKLRIKKINIFFFFFLKNMVLTKKIKADTKKLELKRKTKAQRDEYWREKVNAGQRAERSDDKVTANLRKTFWINCHLPSRLPWKMNFLRGERKQHVVMRFLLSALLLLITATRWNQQSITNWLLTSM